MKGYVRVTVAQLEEAVTGFQTRYRKGTELLEQGINRYYEKNYTNGSWLTKYFNKHKTPRQFARDRIAAFSNWDDLLWPFLSTEEAELLTWWCWTRESNLDSFKSMIAESSDGFALVDGDMVKQINLYRSYKA